MVVPSEFLYLPVVFIGGIAFAVLVLLMWRSVKEQQHPLLKRAPGYPIIGNVLDFLPGSITATSLEYPVKYGPLMEVFILGKRRLFLTDIDIVREVLKARPKKFRRPRKAEYGQTSLGQEKSLFGSNAPVWSHIRKATAPSFNHLNITKNFPGLLNEVFGWMERLQSITTSSTPEVDMKLQPFSLTFRVISVVAFGLESKEIDSISPYFHTQLCQDTEQMFDFAAKGALFPLPMWCWKYTKFYQTELDAKAGWERFTDATMKMMSYKRQLMESNPNYSVSSMLDSILTKKESSVPGSLTDQEIICNVKTIFVAGSDTTANTLGWAAYELSQNPEYLYRARAEAKACLFQRDGKTFKDREEFIANMSPDFVHTDLPFAHAMVKEVLRYYTPSVLSASDVASDTEGVTLSNGIYVGQQDTVWVNAHGVHHNEAVFKEATTFNPDRWLISDEDQLKLMDDHFLPFGYGPRVCPGAQLAMIQGVLAVAFLAYHFDLKLSCPKEEVYRLRAFTAGANKMPMTLSPANKILA